MDGLDKCLKEGTHCAYNFCNSIEIHFFLFTRQLSDK